MKGPATQGTINLAGAILGGIAGYFAFAWLAKNHHALGFAIPGVAVSLAAAAVRCPSKWVAAACGLIGLFAGLFAAWKILLSPPAHRGFGHFLSHVYELPALPLVLILLGGLIAFWFPFRRIRR